MSIAYPMKIAYFCLIAAAVGMMGVPARAATGTTVKVFDFMTAEQIADVKKGAARIDVGAALQKALAAGTGGTTIIPKGVYKTTIPLTVTGSVHCESATLKFYGGTMASLVSQATDGSVRGCTIDGANVANVEQGLSVNTDFRQAGTTYYDLRIKNLSNGDSRKGVKGALFYKASNASVNLNSKLDIKIDVSDVRASPNGKIGDTGGSSVGILISFNGKGTDSEVTVRDSTIRNILPSEDSAGIQLYVADHLVQGAKGKYLIKNARIYNAKKRGIKIQAQNATVRDSEVFGQDTEIGFDTYAGDTVFDNDRYTDGASTGFRTSGPRTRIVNCVAVTNSQHPTLRLEPGAAHASIAHSKFSNSAKLASTANAIVSVNTVSNAIFDAVDVTNASNSGSGFAIAGQSEVRFSNGTIGGTANGVYLPYSTGNFSLINSTINASSNGFARLGATAQTVTVEDSTIDAAIGMNLAGKGVAAVARVSNSVIKAKTHGILAASGSHITDTDLTSTGSAGIGISAGNSVARGNRITRFGVGISSEGTSASDVANNLTTATPKPYQSKGGGPTPQSNNQSR
jgi:hypothetical protein